MIFWNHERGIARDAAFALCTGFGWAWVEYWYFDRVPEAVADEATFQIARMLNRSRAESPAARGRWWRVYSAFPALYREAAYKVWDKQGYQARRVA